MLAKKQIGFIGAGNMATALIRGMLAARLAAPEQISVFDTDAAKVETLVSAHGVARRSSNPDLVEQSDLVVLAVKPQNVSEVLAEIAPAVRNDQCFISIAAGVPLSRLETALGPRARVIRVMPNTPALVGAGAAGISRGRNATDNDLALVRAIFEAVGVAVIVDEKHLDAVTAISGSGPAYVFYFVEALLHAAGRVGLKSEVAQALVRQTVLGAARMVNELDQTPAQLREAVTSPGGTTAAALAVLREGGFADVIVRAAEAATARSIELGKS